MTAAPIGMYPDESAFETVMMSGTTSECSQQKKRPVRPKPVMISSTTKKDAVPVADLAQVTEIARRRYADGDRRRGWIDDHRSDGVRPLCKNKLLDLVRAG